MNDGQLARGLGWFSIGLGLAEVAATRGLSRLVGMEGHEGLVRAFGLREIANGVAILAQPTRAAWLWARVGGDAMDLVALGAAFVKNEPERGRVAAAIGAVAGVAALDVLCARGLSDNGYA